MREIGSIREFSNGNFEIVENVIVPEDKKQKFIVKLNIYALVFMVALIAISFLVFFQLHDIYIFGLGPLGLLLYIFSFVVFIVIHELLHGISFVLFNKTKLSELKFGVIWKSGMAYCISTVPVKVRPARLSLMMPVYVICIPMFLIGMIGADIWILLLSILFVSGSAGDVYYMWKLRKTDKELYMFEEMPTKSGYEIGYLLYKKVD